VLGVIFAGEKGSEGGEGIGKSSKNWFVTETGGEKETNGDAVTEFRAWKFVLFVRTSLILFAGWS